ncbi:MAG: low temperature requirement protein A [Spirochaetes bacterium]|nr:low temperature requirement protein A [Spirochaetota bacterium]
MMKGKKSAAGDETYRVTTLELFFDLVFVFTITELTGLLKNDISFTGLYKVLLLLIILWWMYSGYAWLTNTVAPTGIVRKLLILCGMGGFFIMALSTPEVFRNGGIFWGLGYLIVIIVHGSLYSIVTKNILRIIPFNIIAALLVITASFLDGTAVYACWSAAALIPIITTYIIPAAGKFSLRPAHIVERHGLLMLIAFGESVIAIGHGFKNVPIEAELIGAALTGLALIALFWLLYFAGNEELTEKILTEADDAQRTKLVMSGYFYAHIPMIAGVVCTSVGISDGIHHFFDKLELYTAAILAGGVSLFLFGNVIFRSLIGLKPNRFRICALILVLFTTALGVNISSSVQIFAEILIISMTVIFEKYCGHSALKTYE